MTDNNWKNLAEGLGEYVRDQVATLEEKIDSIPEAAPGEVGAQGIPGEQGPQGIPGEQGPQGLPGEPGESIQGEKGEPGESVQGDKGDPGESIQGPQGETGEKGVGLDAPVWSPGVYREGAEVQHHFGQYFKALKDTADGPDSGDWERIGTSGFRLTGSFSKDADYRDGDLFVKDFGLFLNQSGESLCIAGRGPQGKKGEAGRDGKSIEGPAGVDGKDGTEIKSLELVGSNLVAVVKGGDGSTDAITVSLDPFLEAAAMVTKEASSAENKAFQERAEIHVKTLWENLQAHLTDQAATPVSFFRGDYFASESYQVGDVVHFGGASYLCSRAVTNVFPHGHFGDERSGDYWRMLSTIAHDLYGSGSGDSSGGGGPGVTKDTLITEGGQGGVKFSQFVTVPSDGVEFVGVSGGKNVKSVIQTDAVKVNPIPFRNSRNGQFIGTPEELDAVETQRDYNELVYKWLSEIEAGDVNLDGYLKALTPEQRLALIEAQIQYRGVMELDADDKPQWPADQTKDRGGWWAYPTSKNSGWLFNKLQWLFPFYGEVTEDGSTVTNNVVKGYQVGDVIQLQISNNEAGAGNSYKYLDTQPVFVEYRIEELHYPDRLSGNSNTDFPAYRVSMCGPAHRYTGRLPTEIKGPEGDPSDAWIQWYPTVFSHGTPLSDYAKDDRVDDIENRVEDIEAVLPAADSVAPVPTGDLELKITGSRPTGATGEAGKLLMWKAETGSGGSPYNECKILVPDPSAIDLSASEIWFKQGEVVQKWNVNSGGWFTNVNVLHISTTLTEGDTLVDGQPIEMYYADPGAVYAPVISVAESKSDDRRLQAEIEQLALGLETLLTQRTAGQWRYDGTIETGPPRDAGTFKAMADMSATENYLALHMEDLNGITHAFGDAEIGDYIEVVDMDDPKVYALYVLTAEPPISGTLVELPVKLKDRGADFEVGDSCTIRHFAISEENVNLSELDDRYVNSTGDAMTGTLQVPVIETDAIDAVSPQGTIYTGAMENGNNLVTNQWVKNQISNTPSQTLPSWELRNVAFQDVQPGMCGFVDGNAAYTETLSEVRGIVFSAVDSNGRRVARDRNAIDYQRTYGGGLSILSSDDTTILSMARTIGSVSANIYYSAEFDVYSIIWPGDKDAALTSTTTQANERNLYEIHCPELFF